MMRSRSSPPVGSSPGSTTSVSVWPSMQAVRRGHRLPLLRVHADHGLAQRVRRVADRGAHLAARRGPTLTSTGVVWSITTGIAHPLGFERAVRIVRGTVRGAQAEAVDAVRQGRGVEAEVVSSSSSTTLSQSPVRRIRQAERES